MKDCLDGFGHRHPQGNKAAPATGRGLVTAHTGQVCVPVAGLVGGNRFQQIISEAYASGMTTTEIFRRFNVKSRVLYRALLKTGTALRHPDRKGRPVDCSTEAYRNSAIARFMRSVIPEPNSGCWLWLAGVGGGEGRPVFWVHRKITFAARAAYQLFSGLNPGHLCVCHKCDNPFCVNPDHLFLGAHRDNSMDRVSKGRKAGEIRRSVNRGLPTGIYPTPDGRRFVAKLGREYLGRFDSQETAVRARQERIDELAQGLRALNGGRSCGASHAA